MNVFRDERHSKGEETQLYYELKYWGGGFEYLIWIIFLGIGGYLRVRCAR